MRAVNSQFQVQYSIKMNCMQANKWNIFMPIVTAKKKWIDCNKMERFLTTHYDWNTTKEYVKVDKVDRMRKQNYWMLKKI